jgi:hypothetical protein
MHLLKVDAHDWFELASYCGVLAYAVLVPNVRNFAGRTAMRCSIEGEGSVSDNYACMFVSFDEELLDGDDPSCS